MKTALVPLAPSMPAHFSDTGSSTSALGSGSYWYHIGIIVPYFAVICLPEKE